MEELLDAFDEALQLAALEAFSGSFTPKELLTKFDQEAVLQEAKKRIIERQDLFTHN